MKHDRHIEDTGTTLKGKARERHAKRKAAVAAMLDLAPQDAATIACTVLDEIGAGDAPFDSLSDTRERAEWWAELANPAEIESWFAATAKRLRNQALGIRARKRMFAALWESFTDDDRRAFLARVDPDGTFRAKGAL